MHALFQVISEDADLLVINKPAGLVCHPTKGDALSSLIGRARVFLGPGAAPHLINRLDRETSGVVLVARNPETALQLRRIWEKGGVTKEYWAIVHGHLKRTSAPLKPRWAKIRTALSPSKIASAPMAPLP
jgi:23S rRNA-/tRNA-specific pseudouridylate synthase